jgi:hypothetical protein
MYHVTFFMRPLKKEQFVGYWSAFPHIRCFTDIDYEVTTEKGEVLTSAQSWGRHPSSTNLLEYYSAKEDPNWFSFELREFEKKGTGRDEDDQTCR